MYEVEIKFPVAAPGPLERRLTALAARWRAAVEQIDRYFAHPCRDFAVTDEALRLRQDGDRVVITWKGPRIDATTKTRREIELPLSIVATGGVERPESAGRSIADWTELLEALGFRSVATVSKRRRQADVTWEGRSVAVVLDRVAGLGEYLELELQAEEGEVAAARTCLDSLARELGCGPSERRSYLELLLESRAAR